MLRNSFHLLPAILLFALASLAIPLAALSQSDASKTYKSNCVLCHGPDGSGNTSSGKALGAKDLASSEVQKKSDAELTDLVSKGKGKMPAFNAKLRPDDIKQLVAYIRAMPKK